MAIKNGDGHEAEMVYIPEDIEYIMYLFAGRLHAKLQLLPYRHTAACPKSWARRNLWPDSAMDELNWPAGKPDRRLTNIVLMGMGELYIIIIMSEMR